MKKIKAAGGVVFQLPKSSGLYKKNVADIEFFKFITEIQILLVHRPRYQDWSFPKGKLDPGESAEMAAVREIQEETGKAVVLDSPIGSIEYHAEGVSNLRVKTRKSVKYYIAHVVDNKNASVQARGEVKPASKKEIDEVKWVTINEASSLLTYHDDKNMINNFVSALSHVFSHLPKIKYCDVDIPSLIEYKRPKFAQLNDSQTKEIINKTTNLFCALGINQIVLINKSGSQKRSKNLHRTVRQYIKLTSCPFIEVKSLESEYTPNDLELLRVAIIK